MSINPPHTSGGSRRLGRSGGGQVPPVGLNPSVDTPSRDPLDSFGTLVSASQTAPASGPIRPIYSSPSPTPYDTGFETPHVQRMSSASQAVSTSARRVGTMSPSPAPSYVLFFFFLNQQFITRCSIAVRSKPYKLPLLDLLPRPATVGNSAHRFARRSATSDGV
jgi:hypothetical protein